MRRDVGRPLPLENRVLRGAMRACAGSVRTKPHIIIAASSSISSLLLLVARGHNKSARRAILKRLEPRLHRDGLRGADEPRVVEEVQRREVCQRNNRFRESRELVVVEVELLQARQLTDRVR